MEPNHRLHLATRIHFGLLAQLGVAVAVEDLLGASPEGREALWVCEAMDDPELQAMALEFSGRTAAPAVAPRPRGEVPALHHAVAPRAPMRAKPASNARAMPAWAPTAVHGEVTAEAPPLVPPPAPDRAPAFTFAPVPAAPANPPKLPRAPATPEPAGHVAQPTAWSRDTSGFGFSRPQDLGDAEPPPFVTTADALRPSATPPDISWATALRNRPEPAERPGWKLAFWRKT